MDHRTKAALEIAKHLKPGDVINTGWKMNWWNIWKVKKWLRYIASWRIQEYQKTYFGDQSIWDSTHTRIYLGLGAIDIFDDDIFEVTDPVAQFVSLHSIALEDIRILRYSAVSLNIVHVATMLLTAECINGRKYDRLQLLDYLLHQILGYPKVAFTMFDEGPDQTVCSAGVATLFSKLRKIDEEKPIKKYEHRGETYQGEDLAAMLRNIWPRLFDIVNVDIWKSRGVFDNIDQCLEPGSVLGEDIIRTPIERVTPAHFENSNYFQNEFREVVRFKNGQQYIYPPWDLGPNPEATTATLGTIIVKDEDKDGDM